jgi:hypothetical protein
MQFVSQERAGKEYYKLGIIVKNGNAIKMFVRG